MKALTIALLGLVLSTQVFAKLPKHVLCQNERGNELEMELSPLEATVPIYYVTLSYKGQVAVKFNGYLSESESRFMVEGSLDNEPGDKRAYAGLDYESETAWYMEAANGGMSPLPGLNFSTCAVEYAQ